jgi:hypothetical protein
MTNCIKQGVKSVSIDWVTLGMHYLFLLLVTDNREVDLKLLKNLICMAHIIVFDGSENIFDVNQ